MEHSKNHRPINNTPLDLLKIDLLTGIISVMSNAIIDCDEPPRDSLEYTVLLNDGDNIARGDVSYQEIYLGNL